MPTLRVQLLKGREEDQKKPMTFQEKKVQVHYSRVNMFAGHPSHASKLSYSLPELPKQRKERPITAKSPGLIKKLPKKDINRALSRTASKSSGPHSPSESDSFSIKSSSSSSKSEADSIKKPSPSPDLTITKNASLSMNLSSYLGAQAVEMWSVSHMSRLSKAVYEKLSKGKTLQGCVLEMEISGGNMAKKSVTHGNSEMKALQCAGTEHLRNGGAQKHDTTYGEALKEDWKPGMSSEPALCSAIAMVSETSCCSGDACLASLAGEEMEPIQSLEEVMCQQDAAHEETGGTSHAQHRSSFTEEHGHTHGSHIDSSAHLSLITQKELSNENAPFEADISINRLLLNPDQTTSNTYQLDKCSSRTRPLSSHVSEGGEQDDGFSFESVSCPPEGTHMQDIPSCEQTSMDQGASSEEVAASSREAPARVLAEKYVYTVVGMSPSRTQTHVGKLIPRPGSLQDELVGMREATRVVVRSLTPPPVNEIRCKSNLEEYIPVSPLSLGELASYHRSAEHNGKAFLDDMAQFMKPKALPAPQCSPSKAHWDWRSRSIGARASLRSAVRNLEAAFGGSRSVSLPKARCQTHQTEKKPEGSPKLMARVFASPAKARLKRTEAPQPPTQRFSPLGDRITQDNPTGKQTLRHIDHIGVECAASNHQTLPPSPQSRHQKSEISDIKASRVPIPPTLRAVQDRLAPLKRLSSHTAPLVSTPPASSMRQPNSSMRMMQGDLQCITIDGHSCYTLSSRDSEEMLLAKACAFEHNTSTEGCKWQYTFHSGRSKSRSGKGSHGWRSWLRKDGKSASDLAGKMQVISQVCAEESRAGRRTESLVSEFVLYEERSDDVVRSQSLRFLSPSNSCHTSVMPGMESPSSSSGSAHASVQSSVLQRNKAVDILTSPSSARVSLKSADSSHTTPYSPLKGTPMHQSSYSIDVWSDSDVTEPKIWSSTSGFSPSFHSELAAIVIKMTMDGPAVNEHHSRSGACRRSLKFSHDQSKGSSQGDQQWKAVKEAENTIACGTEDGMPEEKCVSECVTVMLPKEEHGVPKGAAHGPNSLIDRWRCGGKCDCGGWDLGCGMKVFSTCEPCENLHNTTQLLSHNQPLIIYSQGKTREPMLNLSLVQEGNFIINFNNDLSTLKAFAASVAILHSRETLLAMCRAKLTENHADDRTCETNPDREDAVPSKEDSKKPDFLEVCKEIPMWRASSHPVSPYGRI